MVVLDPYCSPVSTVAYRRLPPRAHRPLGAAFEAEETIAADPLASNQARTTLVFFRRVAELRRGWPDLRIVERQRLALRRLPAVGRLLRAARWRPTPRTGRCQRCERALAPLAPLLAFRCLVVLERVGG